MITDAAIIERHSEGCRARCRLELRIVNRLLADIKAAGYTVKISEYEMDGEKTPEDLKDALFNLDEAHVQLFKDGKCMGCVFLVFGNSGWDLVCDYSCKLEEFLKGVNELADKLSE